MNPWEKNNWYDFDSGDKPSSSSVDNRSDDQKRNDAYSNDTHIEDFLSDLLSRQDNLTQAEKSAPTVQALIGLASKWGVNPWEVKEGALDIVQNIFDKKIRKPLVRPPQVLFYNPTNRNGLLFNMPLKAYNYEENEMPNFDIIVITNTDISPDSIKSALPELNRNTSNNQLTFTEQYREETLNDWIFEEMNAPGTVALKVLGFRNRLTDLCRKVSTRRDFDYFFGSLLTQKNRNPCLAIDDRDDEKKSERWFKDIPKDNSQTSQSINPINSNLIIKPLNQQPNTPIPANTGESIIFLPPNEVVGANSRYYLSGAYFLDIGGWFPTPPAFAYVNQPDIIPDTPDFAGIVPNSTSYWHVNIQNTYLYNNGTLLFQIPTGDLQYINRPFSYYENWSLGVFEGFIPDFTVLR